MAVAGFAVTKIPHPVAQVVGWSMVIAGSAMTVQSTATLYDKGADVANSIYNTPGVREHYEEIDAAGQELDAMYGR